MDNHHGPIALEGNAGCGKTTGGRLLANSMGCKFLPEYTETINQTEREFLGANFRDSAKRDQCWVWEAAELNRCKALVACGNAILDTSLMSVIAFELAREDFRLGGDSEPILDAYRELLPAIAIPTGVMVVVASERDRQKRLAARGACHPFLQRGDVARYLHDVRMSACRRYIPRKAWAVVDTTGLSIFAMSVRLYETARKLEPMDLTEPLWNWLSDTHNRRSGSC